MRSCTSDPPFGPLPDPMPVAYCTTAEGHPFDHPGTVTGRALGFVAGSLSEAGVVTLCDRLWRARRPDPVTTMSPATIVALAALGFAYVLAALLAESLVATAMIVSAARVGHGPW